MKSIVNQLTHRKNWYFVKLTLRPLQSSEEIKMSKEIYYSDKYEDDKYEYRHVMLPKVGFQIFSRSNLCHLKTFFIQISAS